MIQQAATNVNISLNGEPRQIAAGSSVADLLAELGLQARHVAVEVNLELVPRASHAEHLLSEGDRLEIVTLVGGG
jgi:thiamine biosynthesis protein ThiS